ncbi:MAG: SRPBCC family protein [Erythrobacter sp.]
MFGFNKKKRMIEGPVEFEAEVEIDRPVGEVWPLLDMADPRFAHAQRGAQVKRDDADDSRYTMTIDAFDDAVFEFTVLESVEGRRHKSKAKMVPQLFALVEATEDYTIEPLGDGSCRVKLVTCATFDEDLSDEEVAEEVATMSEAVTGDLMKLKLLAEDGLDTVMAFEEEQMSFDIELDLEDLDIDWDNIEPEQ